MGLPVQLNFYSNSDVSIVDLMNTADGTFIGKHQVSLTNYDNTSLPAVAIGSIVENNGTLYKFTTESAISGSAVDGTNYILLVPSGDPALGTATVTPTWSQTAPTWSDSKQGWYGTGGSANYRYLEFKMNKAAALYSNKRIFIHDDNIDTIEINYGGVPFIGFDITKNPLYIKTFTGTTSASSTQFDHNISNAYSGNKILFMSVRVAAGGYWGDATTLTQYSDTSLFFSPTSAGSNYLVSIVYML